MKDLVIHKWLRYGRKNFHPRSTRLNITDGYLCDRGRRIGAQVRPAKTVILDPDFAELTQLIADCKWSTVYCRQPTWLAEDPIDWAWDHTRGPQVEMTEDQKRLVLFLIREQLG